MRLKDLLGKEIIDYNGHKYGLIKDADIVLEGSSGQIESIILHNKSSQEKLVMVIPWYGIKYIGSHVVVIDLMNKISLKN